LINISFKNGGTAVKNVLGMIMAIAFGILIGFFGVFNSVFSDGPINERLVVIGVILVICAIFSALWGFIFLKYSWQWGLFISLPGAFFLLFYTLKEFNSYYVLYMILLIAIACLGAYAGSAIRKRRIKTKI
jgi:hypothetical protein